jgi:hypothetical protein
MLTLGRLHVFVPLLLAVPPAFENDVGQYRKKALRHSYIQQSFDHYRDGACKWEMKRNKAEKTNSARQSIFKANEDARASAGRWSFKLYYRCESNAAVRAAVVEELLNNVYYKSAIREVDLPEVERVLESLFNSARAKYNDLSSKDEVFLLNKSLRTKYTSRKSRVCGWKGRLRMNERERERKRECSAPVRAVGC